MIASPKRTEVDLKMVPAIKVSPPGPKSKAVHERCTRYFKGLSSQVRLLPVAFESGHGCTLEDVDGNTTSISRPALVTTLGHCHPKITEAVSKYETHTLMNCHDFSTEIKAWLMEKMAPTLPGNFKGFQLYDCGTAAVEAGLRVCRAATRKYAKMTT